MQIARIKDATSLYTAPKNWDAEKEGQCGDLAVRVTRHLSFTTYESAWLPTPEELVALNKGSPVILSVFGAQPPVMITVEEVAERGDPIGPTYIMTQTFEPTNCEQMVVHVHVSGFGDKTGTVELHVSGDPGSEGGGTAILSHKDACRLRDFLNKNLPIME